MLETWWRVVDGHGQYSQVLNIAHLPSYGPSNSALDSNISKKPPLVNKFNLIERISQCTICLILHSDKGIRIQTTKGGKCKVVIQMQVSILYSKGVTM
jgi:hypothetical protein